MGGSDGICEEETAWKPTDHRPGHRVVFVLHRRILKIVNVTVETMAALLKVKGT